MPPRNSRNIDRQSTRSLGSGRSGRVSQKRPRTVKVSMPRSAGSETAASRKSRAGAPRIVSFADAKRHNEQGMAPRRPRPQSDRARAHTGNDATRSRQAKPRYDRGMLESGLSDIRSEQSKPQQESSPESGKKKGFRAFDIVKEIPFRKSNGKKAGAGSKRSSKKKVLTEEEIRIRKAKLHASRSPKPTAEDAPERSEDMDGSSQKSSFASFVDGRRSKSEQRRRSRNKAKADRKFDAAYGSSNSAAPSQSGPRAAIYEGKMGSSHRKSSKMQARSSMPINPGIVGNAMDRFSKSKLVKFPKSAGRLLLSVAIVAVLCVGLYGPAQEYYVQMRETARLQAEYLEVAERTNNLASSINSLQSEEGIEDKAHTDLGYVKKGEKSATVKGVTTAELENRFPTANVAPGSIPAPETWYSPMLDILFGYGG